MKTEPQEQEWIQKIQDLENHLGLVDRSTLALVDTTNTLMKKLHQPGKRIKVVFLISNISSFDTVEDVIKKMQGDDRFEVFVASIHSRVGGGTFQGEEAVHNILSDKSVSHIRLPEDVPGLQLLKSLDPDWIIRQGRWDADLQEHYGSRYLSFTNLAVIEYALSNLVDVPSKSVAYGPANLDSDMERLAKRIYKAGDSDVSEKLAAASYPDVHNRVSVGSPKVSQILKTEGSWFRETKNKKIYWTAHHSVGDDWLRFGIFVDIFEKMLAFAQEHAEIDVVFCPHPSLFQSLLLHEKMDFENLEAWLHDWDALPNTGRVKNGVDYLPFTKEAQVILTDGLSPLIEGQIALKPIVWIKRADHLPFNREGAMFSAGWREADNFEEAIQKVLELLDVPDYPEKAAQLKNRKFWINEKDPACQIMDDIEALTRTDPQN